MNDSPSRYPDGPDDDPVLKFLDSLKGEVSEIRRLIEEQEQTTSKVHDEAERLYRFRAKAVLTLVIAGVMVGSLITGIAVWHFPWILRESMPIPGTTASILISNGETTRKVTVSDRKIKDAKKSAGAIGESDSVTIEIWRIKK